MQKRTTVDLRSSVSFGKCVLEKSVTFAPYPEVSDFSDHLGAASYFVISRSSDSPDGSCRAGYLYSTTDLVSGNA